MPRNHGRGPVRFLLVLLCAFFLPLLAPDATASAVQTEEGAALVGPGLDTPRVLSIQVEGNQRYGQAEILSALGHPIGVPLDRERIRRGIEVLWEAYRVRAEVAQRETPEGIELRVLVEELPFDPAPRFLGNDRVSLRELFEWTGLEPESEVYLHQAPRIRRQLLAGYKRKGYFFAEVREVVRPGTDELLPDVIFEIREGPRVRVREMVLEGNASIPEQGFLFWRTGLRREARVQSRAPRFFGLVPSYFDQDVLDADLVSMRQSYRLRGFWDAVVEVERLEFSPDRRWVTIHVAVDEGERYRVRSVRVEAVERIGDAERPGRAVESPGELLLPEDELLALLAHQPGTWYTQKDADTDARRLSQRYGEMGHLGHGSLPAGDRFQVLDPEVTFDFERREVDLVYRVAQGRQQFLREVRVSGNRHTRDRVIRRLVSVFPGEVIDLTQVQRSVNRVRGTGYFTDDLNPGGHPEPTFRFVATEDPSWKDLEIQLAEGSVFKVDFGLQIGSDSGLQGLVDLQILNFDGSRWPSLDSPVGDVRQRRAFHGAGQSLRAQITPGTEVSTYLLRFTEPDIFLRHIDRIGLTVGLRRSLRRFRSHDETRTGYEIEFFRQLSQETRVYLGWESTQVDIDNLDTTGAGSLGNPLKVPQLLAEQDEKSRVQGVRIGVDHERLDNRISPRDGFSASLGLTAYAKGLGGDHDFLRADAQWRLFGYFVERHRGPGYRLILRGGVSQPYGDSDDVPYTERFFLGGAQTLRGFAFRGVGPNQNGHPIGGQTFVAGSLEYLHPLLTQTMPGTLEQRDVLRGGLFLDAGILDPDTMRLDPEELRASVGFSFSVVQPLPITLSFGFPIRRGDGDRRRTFNFLLGSF